MYQKQITLSSSYLHCLQLSRRLVSALWTAHRSPVRRYSRCFVEVGSIDIYILLPVVPPSYPPFSIIAISRGLGQLDFIVPFHFFFPGHLSFRQYSSHDGLAFNFPYDLFVYGGPSYSCNLLVPFCDGGLSRLVQNYWCIRGGLTFCRTLFVARYLGQMTFCGFCSSPRGVLAFTLVLYVIASFGQLFFEFVKVSKSSGGFAYFNTF